MFTIKAIKIRYLDAGYLFMFFNRKIVSFLLTAALISPVFYHDNALAEPKAEAEKSAVTTGESQEILEERTSFAKSFAEIVLAVISDHKKSYEARKENLARAFSNSVDIEWIAKFVIGRTWNKASDSQREKYTELYRKFLTKVYVENFAENPDKSINGIKIVNVSNSDTTASDFTVTTQMQLTTRETMKVNYLVRETDKKYKVLDIAIENVSLINTHRAEFTKLATSLGIDGVIKKLEKLVDGKSDNFSLSMN